MPDGQSTSPIDARNPIAAAYLADEGELLRHLLTVLDLSMDERTRISADAIDLVRRIRTRSRRLDLIDAFLQQYGLSSEEGVHLMRLSEALIRTPDFATSRALIRDKISAGAWARHAGASTDILVNSTTQGLRLSSAWITATGGVMAKNLAAKLGDRVMNAAIAQAMALISDHFVLGRSIEAATATARAGEAKGFSYSYDMLGEAAHTAEDARRYWKSYAHAIAHLASCDRVAAAIGNAPGISVKLSALHPRYEFAQRARCVPVLVERVRELALVAKKANLGFTIDAEEADRLEVSLEIFNLLLAEESLAGWDGLGIVVQAYQRRAIPTLNLIIKTARANRRNVTVRLVKGAYWDTEIKRAQELGLESYPVFTRKENTDVSYLACARLLLGATDILYPQFATHNAHTAAAILAMAGDNRHFEFQRLHGMGEFLHAELMRDSGVNSRVYAPVGDHKELLPYLVRRLLENGANSSFVNQLLDLDVDIADIVGDPITIAQRNASPENPKISTPRDLFASERLSARGIDLTQSTQAQRIEATVQLAKKVEARSIINGQDRGSVRVTIRNPTNTDAKVGAHHSAATQDIDNAIAAARTSTWSTKFTPAERTGILFSAADILEQDMHDLIALCVTEAGKTLPDAVAEIREAIDFCRYYAQQALAPQMLSREPLGTVACISPWNFPLAIFLGQITAALAAGNTVIAKPAEQTPLIAYVAVKLLHRAGVPKDALHLLVGAGDIGARLTRCKDIAGLCFTGSIETAKRIAAGLADSGRPDTPLIAETGGLNVMIVDSTALLEQAVQDVVDSAYQSAGQRCSACRIVAVQDDIAHDFVRMLSGSMTELKVGDPRRLSTDVGPVIDTEAHESISNYCEYMRSQFSVIGEAPATDEMKNGYFVRPIAFEVSSIADVPREVFGPVLHLVRFASDELDSLIDSVNALGYGLTMGLHTRIDARVDQIAARAQVGNLYVNRNQIGALVGVQPFGGEGLSGTGPKAGGPHYLLSLSHATPTQDNRFEAVLTAPEIQKANETTNDLDTLINAARAAQCAWAFQGRRAILERTLELTTEKKSLEQIIVDATKLQDEAIALPGPTGEENTLKLYPRGAFALYAAADVATLDRQIITALASGNTLIAFTTQNNRQRVKDFIASLVAAGAPDNLLSIAPYVYAEEILNRNINGAMAEVPDRQRIADRLCRRAGAILPLLSTHDPLPRYFHERTQTINTTAAGGNASLLAVAP